MKVIGFPSTVNAFLRRRLVLGLGVALLIAGGATSVWLWGRAKKPRYVTAPITRGNVRRSIGTTGALNPLVTVQVGSNVSGIIRSLGCDFNTEVQIGQVCATIDPVPFQLLVDQDQAQVGTVEAQIKKDEAALTYAKRALARDTKLRADGSVSQDALDLDRNVYDQAVAQLRLDQASLVEKQAALKGAEVNLAYTHIVSPVVGTVITRAIDVGQTVAASLQSPTLFLIAKDLTRMQVDTNVSEADVGPVRVGQDAYFTVQAFPGRTFRGKVAQIRRGPITVQNVVTYDVVLAISNPDLALFPGMTADAHIVLDEHEDVLRVPLPAVRFNPEGLARGRGEERQRERTGDRAERRNERRSRIWLLRDGSPQPAPVVTGLDDGTLIEVSGEGLAPGDAVVVNRADDEDRRRTAPPAGQNVLRQTGPGPRL